MTDSEASILLTLGKAGIILTPERQNQLIGIAYVNLATLTWGSNIVIGRLLRDSIGPITMTTVRFLVAAMIFSLLLQRQPSEDCKIGKDLPWLAAMALAGVVLFSPMLYGGLRYTTAINGAMINSLAPLLTAVFAVWLLKQPMAGRQISGSLIALTGVLFLLSGGSLSFWQTAQFNIGDLYVLVAAALWGLYSVFASKVMRNRSSISATALSIFIGLPILSIFAIWELQYISFELSLKVILLTVYLGAVPGAGGFYVWNLGVARLGASGAMVFYNTLPLYGAVLSFLFLGEPIGIPHLVGGLLIVSGGIWSASQNVPPVRVKLLPKRE